MKPLKIAILASGRGTVIPSIIDALKSEIIIIISNKADAPVLQLAKDYHIKAQYAPSEQLISEILQRHHIDLILLIGYMCVLSKEFISTWENKILNVHPSLLPAYAALINLAVHRAVIAAGDKETGCTVHIVTNEIDAGPILVQKRCLVEPTDTPEILKARVQKLEGKALIAAIQKWKEEYA
jgi:phosphoribosylglycinamide formyltransferase-1